MAVTELTPFSPGCLRLRAARRVSIRGGTRCPIRTYRKNDAGSIVAKLDVEPRRELEDSQAVTGSVPRLAANDAGLAPRCTVEYFNSDSAWLSPQVVEVMEFTNLVGHCRERQQ